MALSKPGNGHHVATVWNDSLKTFPCLNKLKYNGNGTTVHVQEKSIGPSHDRYGFTTIVVERLGHQYSYISCALRGYRFEMDEDIVVDWCIGNPSTASDMFTAAAGARPDQFENWYNERIYVEDPMDSAITGYI